MLVGVLLAPTVARADVVGPSPATPEVHETEEPAPADADDPPQWGKGPFELRDPFVTALLRASPYARSPRTLDPLSIELGARFVWANSYGYGDRAHDDFRGPFHRFTIESEVRTTDFVFRIGVLPRIELGIEMTAAEWRGGGVLDSMIMGFHQLVGLGPLRRDMRPKDAYEVDGIDPAGKPFALSHRGLGNGDLAFTPRILVLRGSDYWPAVALTARIQLPTAASFLGHARGIAETISVDISKRVLELPVILYAGGAITYYDPTRTDGLDEERLRWMGYAGIEWELRPWISLVAHAWIESAREGSVFRRTNIPYGNQIQYVAAGVKLEPIEGLRLELGIQENFHDPNVTSDFGFLVNVWWRID